MLLDPVLHDHREVLIAAKVGRVGGLQEPQSRIAAALRPAVAVEVGEQPVVGAAVQVDGAAEGRGRERRLRADALPVAAPGLQPGELPRAQEFEARLVDARPIVGRVGDVVGPRAHLGDRPKGTGLELAIFQDRAVEATHHEPCKEHADALGHGGGIDRIGQVPGLLPLHHVDVGGRVEVAAVGAVFPLGLTAAGAPEVGMADVVVVGDRDGGPVADHVAKLQAELEPADRVLRVAVGLVAGEEEQVGIGLPEALHQFGPRPRRARRVARHHGDRDPGLVGRVAANCSLEHRLCPVPHAVGMVAGRIPALDAEVGVPAGIEHGGAGNLNPLLSSLDLEPGLPRLAGQEREELGGERERAARLGPHGHGVDREGDHVAPRHVEIERPGPLRPRLARAGLCGLPPVSGGPAVEVGVRFTEGPRVEAAVGGRGTVAEAAQCQGDAGEREHATEGEHQRERLTKKRACRRKRVPV